MPCNNSNFVVKNFLLKDLTSVINLRNIYAPNQGPNEKELLSQSMRLEKEGTKAYIINKLKLKRIQNIVDSGNIPSAMKPAITLKEITQKLMKEKYEYNLVPQKKTVLPAHLAKGLSKRSKKMIEAYQIKIK